MILLNEPEWDSSNASELREFLRTQSGQRFLAMMAFRRPEFLSSTAHPHKSFANSREVHGYEQAVRTMLGLTESEDKPLSAGKSSSLYPNLDDDSQWLEIPS